MNLILRQASGIIDAMGFRALIRSPALALGSIATLAVGTAAVTISYGLIRAALIREPPFPDAARIALLYTERNPAGAPAYRERWSYPRYQLLEQQQRSFERIANYTNPSFTLSGDADAELVRGELVSPGYFPILGATVRLGRLFIEADNGVDNAAPVALLSHTLWRRRWAGDPGLVGTPIRVNGVNLTVVGVVDEGFHGLSGRAELWVPAAMAPRLTYADYVRTNQNFISVVGRLKPGVSLASARAELAVLGGSINRVLPSEDSEPAERVTASAVSLNAARVDPRIRRSLFVLLGAVSVLHLLACANVTNLLLGRAASRRREGAVRLALGSGSGRLFRHLLAGDLLITLPGTLLGVILAWAASAILVPPTNVWAARNFYGSVAAFDAPVFSSAELGFGLVLALLTAVLVATPAALSAFRLDIQSGIRSGSTGIAGGAITLRRPGLRGLLVALETGLAVLLVVTAGLLLDSYRRMRTTELGVDPANVLTFWLIPSEARVQPPDAGPYITRMLEALRRIPGVTSASVDGGAPLAGTARGSLYIAGRPIPPENQAPPVLRHYIAPDHFQTMGIPVLTGRGFGPGDVAGAPKVTVISETAARRFWPGEDPIGRRVWFAGNAAFGSADSSAEIIGIVGDVAYEPLDRQPNKASFYTPYAQFTYAMRMFFLRSTRDPNSLVPDLRTAIRSVDPDVAMRDVQPLAEVVSGSWARTRFEAMLFGAFGAGALLLAASGIFAVLAYVVASRTREFGIRIALGADTPRVLRLVVGEGLAFPLLGMVLGVGGALAVTRVLRTSLYEVSPLEPGVFLGTVALLLVAAVMACLVPAWRATRSDPLVAMRAE